MNCFYNDNQNRILKLKQERFLSPDDWLALFSGWTPDDREFAACHAREVAHTHFGNKIYVRGLIEFSNHCKNDCLYCGIRRSNLCAERYRLTEDTILECCHAGYQYGFRTFVLQSGEDGAFGPRRLIPLLQKIRREFPDCAITLSAGEYPSETYKAFFDAGATRYLLRHETADPVHYAKLHPDGMSWETRMECLRNLKKAGFQTGCGFMVGSPFQSSEQLAKDLKFIEGFRPEMVGIGPFIPHKDTPFAGYPAGSAELTCYLLSVIRIIHPTVLLPATTALGTLGEGGREKGILHGANVIMPNLSPTDVRSKYMLYDNKLSTGAESAQKLNELKEKIKSIGYEIVCDRGDFMNAECKMQNAE